MNKKKERWIIKSIQESQGYEELAELLKKSTQTPEIVKAALQKNGMMLEFVQEQTPELCMLAVKEDGGALKFVKEQTAEICLEAVTQDGLALKYVKEQTKDIVDAALKQNPLAKSFVKGPEEEKSSSDEGRTSESQISKDSRVAPGEEAFIRAQKEADEAFWAQFGAKKKEQPAQDSEEEKIDFAKLEQEERKANEAAYRFHQKKEEEKVMACARENTPGFGELEAEQRKADEIFLKMYIAENSSQLGKDVSKIMNDEKVYSDDTMKRLCQKYIEYCREQGVPENVLSLMSNPGFSLPQMMQIKFGYEDGLSLDDIASYAKPELEKNQMVISRYNLLTGKNLGVQQTVDRMAAPNKKPALDSKIAGAKSRANKSGNGKEKAVSNEPERV